MTDEFDSLFGLQADTPATAPDPHPQPELPTVRLPLFKPGTQVYHDGQWCTVNYVTLRRNLLLVQFHEIAGQVDASKLRLEPSELTLRRH